MATALPTAASFTGSTVTEAQFKTAITDLRSYLATLFGSDGEAATALATLGANLANVDGKSTTYQVLEADRGTLINCTSGTFTITTPAAATVGAGFVFGVHNAGAGTVTLDGNASETIDGSATVDFEQYDSGFIVSDGTNWVTVGRVQSIGSGEITTDMIADEAVTWAKMGGGMGNVQKAASSGTQNHTISWATYVSDSITVEASSTVIAVATLRWDQDHSNTSQARLLIDGTTVDSTASNEIRDDQRVTLVGIKSGLTSGAKTVALQIIKANVGDAVQAITGDILSWEQKG